MNKQYRRYVAKQMINSREAIAQRWLESLKTIVHEDTNNIFPTDQYLDHVPAMLGEIATIFQDDDTELALCNSLITQKALELGSLRHEQDATVSQLLREYDLLAQHLEDFLLKVTSSYPGKLDAIDMMHASSTIHAIVRRVLQDTVNAFVSSYVETINVQTEKLRHYNNFVGHEIRTPLQTALLNIELMLDAGDQPQNTSEGLDDVQDAINQVISIINNVELLVNPDKSEKVDTPATQRINVVDLVNDIATQFRQSLTDQEIRLEIADDLGEISTDTGKLRLILTNLFSNAVKYSDPDRANSYIRIKRHNMDDHWVSMVIEDNGIGISSELLPKVTDLNVRAYNSQRQAKAIDGHGIGLYLVGEAVVFLRGEMSIDSIESEGTSVTISLPQHL